MAPTRPARMEGDALITNENLFDVPADKEDKKTADEELSPPGSYNGRQDEEMKEENHPKTEIASQALDLPQTSSNQMKNQE